MIAVMTDQRDMEEFLTYELSQQLPLLFHQGLIRKNNKSYLAQALNDSVPMHVCNTYHDVDNRD